MSTKEQTPSTTNLHKILIVIIAVMVIGTLWFAMQSKDNADKSLNNTKKAQSDDVSDKSDQYKGWKNYTWASEGVSFKHPGDWVTSETSSMGRLYVKNSNVDLLKEETPENFQQIWLSVDTDESAKSREDAIKAGTSEYRQVSGAVKASTLESGSLTINTYEYNTLGGPTLEAYWTNKNGKRLFATTSTEVGEKNQQGMVATLKQLLASVSTAE